MADTTSTEKIYCTSPACSNSDALSMAALMGNGGLGGNQWNNPFIYLVWMMFANRFWNNGNSLDGTTANISDNYNSRALSQLQSTVDNNHNNQVVLDAMGNNQEALRELAQTFNTDINTIQQAICGVKSAIENVAGQVGFSSERVINAVNLGDANLTQQVCNGLCNVKSSIVDSNYQNQLATERQTGILGTKIDSFSAANALQSCQNTGAINSRIDQLSNGIQSGFAQIGYQNSQDTCSIITAINAAQQRTADQLAVHWQAETSQALQDAKFEVSQLKQNQYLASLLNGGCNCGSN